MSDVLDFKQSEPPTLKDKFGDDDWVLKACAEWRASRAQMQKNWAEHDLANGWGTLPDAHIKLDSDPLERMQRFEELLSIAKPRTMLLACELLGICATILAYEGEARKERSLKVRCLRSFATWLRRLSAKIQKCELDLTQTAAPR